MSAQEDYIIATIIQNFLGSPKNESGGESRVQWEYNCPSQKCRADHNKYNLSYNSKNHIFKCWKCKYSGFISRLVSDYGSKEDLRRLRLLLPDYKHTNFNIFRKPEIDHNLLTCSLPEGYMPLNSERKSRLYELARNYVINVRKISENQIDKLNIGYTENGPRKYRIIIPSYNSVGKINYYEARTYLEGVKPNYFGPESPNKEDIIFNEKFINWDLPVYLVEGVFDAIRIPNAIPMLGKTPSPLLINKLLKQNAKVIICLDSDALKDGIDIYKQLTSLGLDVYFVDLKGKKDISKIFEDDGQTAVVDVLKTARKLDASYEFVKLLNE